MVEGSGRRCLYLHGAQGWVAMPERQSLLLNGAKVGRLKEVSGGRGIFESESRTGIADSVVPAKLSACAKRHRIVRGKAAVGLVGLAVLVEQRPA